MLWDIRPIIVATLFICLVYLSSANNITYENQQINTGDFNNIITYISLVIVFISTSIAVISFWWMNLRSAHIVCNPIRYISVSHLKSMAVIVPNLVLTNSGGSNAVIDYIFINLKDIKSNKMERFNAIAEDLPTATHDNDTEFKIFNPLDYPMLPFVVEKSTSINKKIWFGSDSYCFKKGIYNIEIYVVLSGSIVIHINLYNAYCLTKISRSNNLHNFCI